MSSNDGSSQAQQGEHPMIVAAIPCFNEERFIGSVVLKAKKYVDSVVVIDDGSTDASAEVAAEAGAMVYRHPENRGYGAGVRSALEKGRELGADVVVILDGDGQHDPKDIPRLVQPVLDKEADVVVGSRFLGHGRRPPLYRRLGQHVLTAVTNLSSGHVITDSQSGFRAYSSRALRQLTLVEDGMAVSSEMQFAISKAGLKVAEVPISVSYMGKAKRSPVGHGLSVLSRILVLVSLRQPLLLFGVPGVVLMASGLVLGGRVLAIYGDTRELALGNALGAVMLCLAALLALFAALMLQSMKELLRREWERFESSGTTLAEDGEESRDAGSAKK
ncbi:MAG: glycosyltransferase family 2 protein [Chloroflexi bacterium]|mgnify:FL=1|nr:MAG: glycosyltransferase family 2 protein [Chloroflexota bacterium]